MWQARAEDDDFAARDSATRYISSCAVYIALVGYTVIISLRFNGQT